MNRNADLADWLRRRDPTLPTVGITFYRAHWISGNTAFVDALVRECKNTLLPDASAISFAHSSTLTFYENNISN